MRQTRKCRNSSDLNPLHSLVALVLYLDENVHLLAVGVNGLIERCKQMHFAFAQEEGLLDFGAWRRDAG